MQNPRNALVLSVIALAVLLGAQPAAAGKKSCVIGTAAEVADDFAQLEVLITQIDSECPCAGFDGVTPGGSKKDYKACWKRLVAAAVSDGRLRKQCRGAVNKTYQKAVCGLPPATKPKLPCVKKKEKNGKVGCALRPADKCTPRPGKFTAVSCPLADNCVAAGDTDGNYFLTPGDAGECSADPMVDDTEERSAAGRLVLVGELDEKFNPAATDVLFQVENGALKTGPNEVTVIVNDDVVPDTRLNVLPGSVEIAGPFAEGRSTISVFGSDVDDGLLGAEVEIWFGDNSLEVQVEDEGGAPVDGATVTIQLADDRDQISESDTVGGTAAFSNLPSRTILIEAVGPGGAFGSAGAVGGVDTQVLVVLKSIGAPSPVENNDFSQGTDGWEFPDGGGVSVDPHVEDPGAIAATRAAAPPNNDLTLTTAGEGAVTANRTFTVGPGIKSVRVRYRFVTSEFPTFFGSQFNDFFGVSIQSPAGNVSEVASMNGLGSTAFFPNGATAWREKTLSPVEPGEVVRVEALVANVGDGLFDSSIVVDFVDPGLLAITHLAFFEEDSGPPPAIALSLKHLSASPHTYFGGVTRLDGQITIEGEEGDEVTSVELQVVQNGAIVAKAGLSPDAAGQLLERFGPSEKLELLGTDRLFDLVSGKAQIDTSANGLVELKAVVKSASGGVAERSYGNVELLRRVVGGLRYGSRDPSVGGDDWAVPAVVDAAAELGIRYGDFSNMNAGPFSPHGSHRTGRDVDAHFGGYNALDALAGVEVLKLLNDPVVGNDIVVIFVGTNAGTAFHAQLAGEMTINGRDAASLVKELSGHNTHLHLRLKE